MENHGRELSGLRPILISFYVGLYLVLPIGFLFLVFLLPGAVWDMLRFVVGVPFLLWHYLHYLFMPHPMEEAIIKHEKMKVKRGVKVDHAVFVEEMSRAKYDPKKDGVPVWWKSKNKARRLKDAMALRERVKTEKQVADVYIDDIRERNKYQ